MIMKCAATLALLLSFPSAATAEFFDCVIIPAVTVQLGAPVSGLLDQVLVDQGDLVVAGQKVATLRSEVERTTLEVLVLQAESRAEIEAQVSRLALAEKRLARVQNMVERSIAPREGLDTAEAEVEVITRELAIAEMRQKVAILELERARQQITQREILSPVNGVVIVRHRYDGEFLPQDGYVVTIAQISPLIVEAFLPVSYYRSVVPGEVLRVLPDPPVGGDYNGIVNIVDRVFDAASGTFGIRVLLDNTDLSIPAGSRCQIELKIN